MKKEKKAISPIVSTVLLIAIVVVIAAIIFLWARGFVKESVMKSISGVEMSADQACELVQLSVKEYIGGVQIINNGNVPINGFDIKISTGGTSEIRNERDNNIGKGQSLIYDITESYDKLEVIPVLLGTVKGVQKLYTCKISFLAEQ